MTTDEFESRIAGCRRSLLMVAQSRLPYEACEDAVQSAILSAWEHLEDLRCDAAFDAWIRQILLNECSAYYRKCAKESAVNTALAASQREDEPDGIGLDEALNKLSAPEKRLLLLHHNEGYSVSELAAQSGETESVIKMRLYRARKRLRVALITMLLLLLLAAAAIATGYLNVNWFLANRRASQPPLYTIDFQSDSYISYDGTLLCAEISDVIWDMDKPSLLFTYELAGTSADALTVYSGSIGVDGERFDHIWTDDDILPVVQWANGKQVYCYSLDTWRLEGACLPGSEDFLPEEYEESFFAEFSLNALTPEQLAALASPDNPVTLTCHVFIYDHASGTLLEEGNLTAHIAAPDAKVWRAAYEAYSD